MVMMMMMMEQNSKGDSGLSKPEILDTHSEAQSRRCSYRHTRIHWKNIQHKGQCQATGGYTERAGQITRITVLAVQCIITGSLYWWVIWCRGYSYAFRQLPSFTLALWQSLLCAPSVWIAGRALYSPYRIQSLQLIHSSIGWHTGEGKHWARKVQLTVKRVRHMNTPLMLREPCKIWVEIKNGLRTCFCWVSTCHVFTLLWIPRWVRTLCAMGLKKVSELFSYCCPTTHQNRNLLNHQVKQMLRNLSSCHWCRHVDRSQGFTVTYGAIWNNRTSRSRCNTSNITRHTPGISLYIDIHLAVFYKSISSGAVYVVVCQGKWYTFILPHIQIELLHVLNLTTTKYCLYDEKTPGCLLRQITRCLPRLAKINHILY